MADYFTREEAEAKVGKKVRHLIDDPYPFRMFKKGDVWDVTGAEDTEDGYIVYIAPKLYQYCTFTSAGQEELGEHANEHVYSYCYTRNLYYKHLTEVD